MGTYTGPTTVIQRLELERFSTNMNSTYWNPFRSMPYRDDAQPQRPKSIPKRDLGVRTVRLFTTKEARDELREAYQFYRGVPYHENF